jgi:acyl-CoA reductase-like NAD-dependent aldehyde dehydrogenase
MDTAQQSDKLRPCLLANVTLSPKIINDTAQVLAGGSLVAHPSGGQFYAPTVLTGVTPAMRIWREEVFGPVLAVVRVNNDDEAVAAANDCAFGLSSAVFSRSAARANAVAARLEVGPATAKAQGHPCLPPARLS